MLNFFKKKEVNNLDTPKNLPELAKDMFEPPQNTAIGPIGQNASIKEVPTKDAKVQPQKEQQASGQRPPRESYKLPNVPSSSDVPRLDLGLIRSANIAPPNAEIPEEAVSPSKAVDDSRMFSLAEQFNAINRLRSGGMHSGFGHQRLNQMPVDQRNIYINKGNALFDELESAIAGNNPELARNIIDNILPLLYEYHEIDSMNDADRIRELKDLEKFWTLLQKKNHAVKSVLDSIESDIVRKSNMLMSGGSTNISNNISSDLYNNMSSNAPSNISSAKSSSISQSSSIAPSFFPLIKTGQNMYDAAKTELPISASPENIYIHPHERFYFKDGKIASSLKDLYYMMNDISDDTFYHHVSIERNDFANWVKDVLKQPTIAKEISNIYSRRELIEFLKYKL